MKGGIGARHAWAGMTRLFSTCRPERASQRELEGREGYPYWACFPGCERAMHAVLDDLDALRIGRANKAAMRPKKVVEC
jgi:hypothetical protein